MGFTKLDSGIVDSSIWSAPYATRVVWVTFLAKKNQNGFVVAAWSGMQRACNVTTDEFKTAIEALEGPDPESRTPDFDGRRIKKIDGGWLVLNHQKYRDFSYSDNPESVRKRAYRNGEVKEKEGYIYFLEFKDRIKIGFSKNPWSRTSEFKTTLPDSKLIGTYQATMSEEKELHKKFNHLNLEREWFKNTDELVLFIEDVVGHVPNVAGHSVSASVSESVSESDKCIEFKKEIESFVEYSSATKSAFFDYWSEPNRAKTKMRFELQKTWDTKRRLNTWALRENDFKKPIPKLFKKETGIPDWKKPLIEAERQIELEKAEEREQFEKAKQVQRDGTGMQDIKKILSEIIPQEEKL